MRQGNHVLGIFIDLSKAFDTSDQNLLIQKLEQYGIRGHAILLIKSEISNKNSVYQLLPLGDFSDQFNDINS